MNELLQKSIMAIVQIRVGESVNVDFDLQFIAAERQDAYYSFKKEFDYFPSVMTINNTIVGIENRDGNANVRFCQGETPKRMFSSPKNICDVSINRFRADCGSFSESIVKTLLFADFRYLQKQWKLKK